MTLPKGDRHRRNRRGLLPVQPAFREPLALQGEGYRDIPLLANREVRLSKTVLDNQGKPVMGEDGEPMRDTVYAMPAQIKATPTRREAATCRRRPRRATSAPWRSARATPEAGASELANEHAP